MYWIIRWNLFNSGFRADGKPRTFLRKPLFDRLQILCLDALKYSSIKGPGILIGRNAGAFKFCSFSIHLFKRVIRKGVGGFFIFWNHEWDALAIVFLLAAVFCQKEVYHAAVAFNTIFLTVSLQVGIIYGIGDFFHRTFKLAPVV